VGLSATKILRPLDYRSTSGRMLRGNPVYKGGSSIPNPTGVNTKRAASLLLKKRKSQNGR